MRRPSSEIIDADESRLFKAAFQKFGLDNFSDAGIDSSGDIQSLTEDTYCSVVSAAGKNYALVSTDYPEVPRQARLLESKLAHFHASAMLSPTFPYATTVLVTDFDPENDIDLLFRQEGRYYYCFELSELV